MSFPILKIGMLKMPKIAMLSTRTSYEDGFVVEFNALFWHDNPLQLQCL